jgi:hypothetical protein
MKERGDYMNSTDEQVLTGLFAFGAAIMIFLLIWGIAAYLLGAFALNKMAKREGTEDAYLAFIPIVQLKVWGDLVEKKLPDFFKPQAGWKVLAYTVGLVILGWIPFIGFIANIASIVLGVWIVYLILERYSSNAVLFTILHIITGSLFFPLHLFLIRNKDPHY